MSVRDRWQQLFESEADRQRRPELTIQGIIRKANEQGDYEYQRWEERALSKIRVELHHRGYDCGVERCRECPSKI